MPTNKTLLAVIATLVMIGCSESERIAEIAVESADRQAQQNEQMAELHKELAEGSKRLVESDAQAREDLISLQHKLQDEQTEVARQRDVLEIERKDIARQRRTESGLPTIINGSVMALLAIAVFGFCWYLLFGLQHRDDTDSVLNDLLITEMTADRPNILPLALPPVDEGESEEDRLLH